MIIKILFFFLNFKNFIYKPRRFGSEVDLAKCARFLRLVGLKMGNKKDERN